ncbi:acyl-CoA dehydrogenase family protein [Achromobacter sp. F4_2707]|uniref:acyl-CoA dehydrogenase family protein n=1 Tax=Achromobacter sp. F4_2707 TaxID=3114286 RepID=UPI0039C688B2
MGWNTHEVTNQVPDLVDYNLYAVDTVLQEAVVREGAGKSAQTLSAYGGELGQAPIIALAARADRYPPQARPFDRQGHRIDSVDFDPGWHAFLAFGVGQGLHQPASVARAAAFLLHGQIEMGTLCPLTMTSAAIPILSRQPWFSELSPLLFSHTYDERDTPLADKRGMLVGMGLTEKQGGSDLRRATTLATPVQGEEGVFRLVGHKWFFSVPTADAHLVLALLEGEPTCFYVPRWLPDGRRNAVWLMQLKDKLGNRSNASAEVEFQDAEGVLVGEPGRGIATLVEMAGYTRLDCVLGSTALMRAALVQAMHHAQHRVAFGRPLLQQPLMRAVLMDLALEVEAAVALAMRLARAVAARTGPLDDALARIVTPAAKFWVCKRAIPVVAEALEALGGNGYIESHILPRLYREAPVNSLWEGSGNVMCLDVLRAVQRHPDWWEALLGWLRDSLQGEALADSRLQALVEHLSRPAPEREAVARNVAGTLVLLVQAALLRGHAPQPVADTFIASRLGGDNLSVPGMMASPAALDSVLQRAWAPAFS